VNDTVRNWMGFDFQIDKKGIDFLDLRGFINLAGL
jgi:hypothetical protein